MRVRVRLIVFAAVLAWLAVYTATNWRLVVDNRKYEISDAKRKFRELRAFKRDMASFEDLDIMKEMMKPRPFTKFLIEPWKLKKRKRHKEFNLSMVIMVKSHTNNSEKRTFIRETWGSRNHADDLSFDVAFILGTTDQGQRSTAATENEIHGDILQINYNETYENLVFKTLAGMQWVEDNFPHSYFYASMDDDVLPNFGKISQHIHEIIETELDLWKRANQQDFSQSNGEPLESFLSAHDLPLYCGFGYRVKTRPKRNDASKWHLDDSEYPLKRYPPYCFGGFYAMTVSLMSKFHSLARKLPIFWIDDIWLTGFVRVRYFASKTANCIYCKRNSTVFGIWTEVPDNFAGAITGDLDSLEEEWIILYESEEQ